MSQTQINLFSPYFQTTFGETRGLTDGVVRLGSSIKRFAGQLLPQGLSKLQSGEHDNTRGVNPVPFHGANITLHAVATCLVFWLARRLAAIRDLLPHDRVSSHAKDSPSAREAPAGTSGQLGLRQRRKSASDTQLRGRETPSQVKPAALVDPHLGEALLAALLFALHPIHTEAVAGIVGQAELLCAALSILAFLAYMAAADGRADERGIQLAADRLHWPLMAAAVCLTWLAALAKEIGITMVAAMMIYDILLAPVALQRYPAGSGPRQRRAAWSGRLRALLSDRMAHRVVVMAAAVLLYVKGRSLLAGDHLVRIFRKVENPIPFAESALTRTLSLGYLHAKYASLLVVPLQLSADWSFECVPLVDSLADPRNIMTAAVYAWLLWTLFSIQPWHAAAELWDRVSGRPDPGAATSYPAPGLQLKEGSALALQQHTQRFLRWQCLVSFGLLVAPFFPASNVLFYVGTFIGERLLYLPSVGFCLLASGLLCRAANTLQQQLPNAGLGWQQSMLALWGKGVLVGLLLAYAARTVMRNFDWVDEEQLFIAAQKVCWNSAKVQLNSGILQRRYQNWDAAIGHFEHARAVEPGYCEPGYWVGLCLINKSAFEPGIKELEGALDCKYVAADAATALVAVHREMQKAAQKGDPRPHMALARVLLHPTLQHVEEACNMLEQAVMGLRSAAPWLGTLPSPAEIMQPCDRQLKAAARNSSLASARSCVHARAKLLSSLQSHQPTSAAGKKAAYKYAAYSQRHDCRHMHTAPRGPSEAHAMAVNVVQSADAEDPWLQAEWGQTLLAEGPRRVKEAVTHLHVAGMLFANQAQLVSDDHKRRHALPFKSRLGIDLHTGKVQQVGQWQMLQAAIWVFELSVQHAPEKACNLLQSACTLRSKYLDMLHSIPANKNVEMETQRRALHRCVKQMEALHCGS